MEKSGSLPLWKLEMKCYQCARTFEIDVLTDQRLQKDKDGYCLCNKDGRKRIQCQHCQSSRNLAVVLESVFEHLSKLNNPLFKINIPLSKQGGDNDRT